MLYLDQAATSFPKPAPVLIAVERWFREFGVSADRGDSHRTTQVRQIVLETRKRLGSLFDLPGERVAFTSGCTESLNLFLRGFLRPGDHVLTTAFEHSSLVRPLLQLQRERDLTLTVLPPDAHGGLDAARVAEVIADCRPRLFAFTHASNVTGALFDAELFCKIARAHDCTTLLDASQTAGHFALNVGADAIVGSAHKALLAPPGLGFLAVRTGVPLATQKQGGTGSSRALDSHPSEWPTAFEAGTANTPAIFGLHAALGLLAKQPAGSLLKPALDRTLELAALLAGDARVRVFSPPLGARTPVLSFTCAGFDPAELGAMFDAADIHVRTGHHCAPWLHRHLGTEASGTVRISPGAEISAADIRSAAAVLAS
jgi:selenocysteine lyase/cysteine desulfurase